jgi:hypothetical protein
MQRQTIQFANFVTEMEKQLAEVKILGRTHKSSDTKFYTVLTRACLSAPTKESFEYDRDTTRNMASILKEEMASLSYENEFDHELMHLMQDDNPEHDDIIATKVDEAWNSIFSQQHLNRKPFAMNISLIQSLIDFYSSDLSVLNEWEQLSLIGCEQVLQQYKSGVLRCAVIDKLFGELNTIGQGMTVSKAEEVLS